MLLGNSVLFYGYFTAWAVLEQSSNMLHILSSILSKHCGFHTVVRFVCCTCSPCWDLWGWGTCPHPVCGRCRWRSARCPMHSPCSGWSGLQTHWAWTAVYPGSHDVQSLSRDSGTHNCGAQKIGFLVLWCCEPDLLQEKGFRPAVCA